MQISSNIIFATVIVLHLVALPSRPNAQTPVATADQVLYFRNNESSDAGGVYKVLASNYARQGDEVEATHCVSNTNKKLPRLKLLKAAGCGKNDPNTGPGAHTYIIVATIASIKDGTAILTYTTVEGGTQTITLPASLIKSGDLKVGSSVAVFPKDLTLKTQSDVLKSFKSFERSLVTDPSLTRNPTFSVQLLSK